MATEGQVETTRTTVKTYVPKYQRDEWDAHAEDLEMTRSEFVRSMVQAGRRGFSATEAESTDHQTVDDPEAETTSQDPDPDQASQGVESFEETIVRALQRAEYLSWDELLDAITDDLETRLEEALRNLQANNRVRYSGPNGGYTLDE